MEGIDFDHQYIFQQYFTQITIAKCTVVDFTGQLILILTDPLKEGGASYKNAVFTVCL